VEDWLVWAAERALDPRVVAFIQKHHEHLDGLALTAEEAVQTAGLVKTPDRRAWARVAAFIAGHPVLDDIHIKMIAGMVGSQAALAFKQALGATLAVTAEQILLAFARHRAKLKAFSLQDIVLLNEQILLYLNVQRYPRDKVEEIRKNLLAYLKHVKRTGQNEAVAHFASLAEGPRFERAMAMIAESLDLIGFLTDYIQGIQVI